MNIKIKMILFILLPTLALFLFNAFIVGKTSSDALTQYASKSTEQYAREAGSTIEKQISEANRIIEDINNIVPLLKKNEYTDREILPELLLKTLEENTGLFAIWIYFEPDGWDGKDYIYANTEEYDETGNYAVWAYRDNEIGGKAVVSTEAWGAQEYEADYYSIPRTTRKMYLSEPYSEEIYEGNKVQMVSVSSPLFDEYQNVIGVAGLDISLVFLTELLSQIDQATGGFSTVIQADGLVITDSKDENEGLYLSDLGFRDYEALSSENASYIKNNNEEYLQITNEINIVKSLPSWLYIISIPIEIVFELPNRIIRLMTVIGVSVFVLLIIILLLFASKLTASIKGLMSTFTVISSGDLSAEAEVKTTDEAGELVKEFNKLSETISSKLKVVKQSMANLKENAASLTRVMGNTEEAFTSSAAAITDAIMAGSGIDQSINGTIDSIENIANNLKVLEHNVGEQNDIILESFAAIEEMIASINSTAIVVKQSSSYYDKLADSSRVGEQLLNEVIGQIMSIQSQSENLLDTNTLISNIASQTNLLSMNAAIEAAHAGEAGKGFSVVADEIRKLSEETTNNSKRIDQILKNIVDTITAISDSSTNAGNNFSGILDLIKIVSNNENEINLALQEQSSGSKQILASLDEMKSSTNNVHDETVQMSNYAAGILKETSTLKENADNVKNNIHTIFTNNEDIKKAVSSGVELTEYNSGHIESVDQSLAFFTLKE